MSAEQRQALEAVLRQSSFPADSDINEQRRLLKELVAGQPLPPELTVTAATLGGVPVAEITIAGIEPRHVVLYFHGGVYVLGDAFQAADLASQVGRRTSAKVFSVDYRLAPSTRFRRRSTTLSRPTRRSCTAARPRRTSSSRASRPAAGSPSPPWSTPAITGFRGRPRRLSCRRMPTSPWPGGRWTARERPTRC
jgi:alpha/beta hydrolase fold